MDVTKTPRRQDHRRDESRDRRAAHTVPDGDARDIDRAVAAAAPSFEEEAGAASILEEGKNPVDIAELLVSTRTSWRCSNRWRTADRCRSGGSDVGPAIDAFRYYAGWVRRYTAKRFRWTARF